jgi:hypothetical protein
VDQSRPNRFIPRLNRQTIIRQASPSPRQAATSSAYREKAEDQMRRIPRVAAGSLLRRIFSATIAEREPIDIATSLDSHQAGTASSDAGNSISSFACQCESDGMAAFPALLFLGQRVIAL